MLFVFIKKSVNKFGLNSVSNFEGKKSDLQHEIIWFKLYLKLRQNIIPFSGSAKRRRKPLVKQRALTWSESGFFSGEMVHFLSGVHMWILNGKSNQLLRWSSILHTCSMPRLKAVCERVWWPLVVIYRKEGVEIQRYSWSAEAASGRWPPLTRTHSRNANCIGAVRFWLPAPE